MIKLTLNGEEKTLEEQCVLSQAINYWQLQDKSFAVAINEHFIPKSVYQDTLLQEGDRVELLVPMQGG